MQVDKMENALSERISLIALACRLRMTFYAAAIFSEGPSIKDVGIFYGGGGSEILMLQEI